ncbi:MAG: DNA polymerase III subunit gamma and tau [Actinobacteria bacterium]|nr:DNA polymerase III subunit gamma and tau [Actinomycetota bacterium]
MEASSARSAERGAGLALYRAYRPGTLAEVIGQDHITIPLGRAVDSGRAHHAYLFTGPRGCGKTSSARILARCLNCEQGPTSKPCGVCQSCIDLAPNGPGSVDVLEIDAATHGGVDEARDLRERAVFAPAQSRYRVYIIDEAHQLSNAAANALLKLIEEPPPHLKFVFATTEPDKIIGTIRSRTHHYPFRLIPARVLQQHLAWVCESEDVKAEPGALAVVARAAAGSARDALSVLGQVLAGAGPEGLVETEVVSQLGVTDRRILDDVVTAVASGDAAVLFSAVTRILDGGTEPRRFAGDLLERLRDLVLLAHVPEHDARELIDAPDAVFAAMREQAQALGAGRAGALAATVSDGMADLRGATAPRLQLELLCARLLFASDGADVQSRIAALERRSDSLASAGAKSHASASTVAAGAPVGVSGAAQAPADTGLPTGSAAAAQTPTAPRSTTSTTSASAAPVSSSVAAGAARPVPPPPPAISKVTGSAKTSGDAGASAVTAETLAAAPTSDVDALTQVVTQWSNVVDAVGGHSRVSWSLLSGSTAAVANGALQVLLPSPAIVNNARQRGLDDVVRSAVESVCGVVVRVEFGLAQPSAQADDTFGARVDDDVEDAGPVGIDAITQVLGGTVISEFERDERN